ncbi:MAG: hypothetical protein ACFE9C_08455 [Candidatus Hodarchaeota archaeon]
MLQEPLVFFGVYIISLLLSYFLLSERAGIIKDIALRLFFIGVYFHEVAHYGMSLAVGRIPKDINVYWRDRINRRNPHGVVREKDCSSFLQAIVVSFAPLYLSTWVIFYLWFGVIFTPFYDPLIKTIAVFALISLLLTAAPSGGDLKAVWYSFKEDLSHSWYQVLLISLSIIVLWVIVITTEVIFILDVFYYLAIAGIYLLLKFTFIGLRRLVIRIDTYNFKKPQKVSSRRFARRRYKPTKPWREN